MKKLLSIATAAKTDPAPSHELVYRQLRQREIRLVKLLPGSSQSTIRCELEISSLESCQGYDALSYRWGEVTSKNWIACNSQRCNVTRDLHIALKRFRRRGEVVTFWIDQICINQADFEERAEQVKMMQEIYSRAQSVVVWLGPESDDSKLAMQTLPSLSEIVRKYDDSQEGSCVKWSQYLVPAVSARTDKEWKALSALIGRPWFGRVWVVQEIVVAGKAVVVCGRDELQWRDFADGISQLLRVGMNATGFMPTSHWRFIYMCNIIKRFRNSGHIPPEELLPQSRFFEASDGHDNVFAVIGLSPKERITEIDYSKPVNEVYTDVAKKLILKHRTHAQCGNQCIESLLCRSQGFGELSLPSWVPDWSRPSNMDFELSIRVDKAFKAGGPGKLDAVGMEDWQKIRLRGKIFDSVGVASSVAPAPSTAELDKAFSRAGDVAKFYTNLHQERYLLNCWINETSAIAWNNSFYSSEQARVAAYSRTLICNNLTSFGDDIALDRAYWAFRACLGILFPRGVPNGAPLGSIAYVISPHLEKFEFFELSMYVYGVGRRFFTTTGGYMALGNASVEPEDLVCVFEGASCPWVIRRVGQSFLLIGECYVHGVMDGEVMETESLKIQDIILE